MKALLPHNEVHRIKMLRQYKPDKMLDSNSETSFDDLTRLASYICGTPIALVCSVEATCLHIESKVGWEKPEMPLEIALCAHTILQSDVLIVPDTTADRRFATNPFVTRDPYVRFYAGVPLTTSDGYVRGSLCVMDYIARQLKPEQIEALRVLGRQATQQLAMRPQAVSVVTSPQRVQEPKERRQFFKRVAGGFGLASAILVLMGVVSYHSIKGLAETNNRVAQTQDRIRQLETVLAKVKDVETRRSYPTAGKDNRIIPYYKALEQVAQEIQDIKKLRTNNPKQLKALDTLEPLIAAKLAETQAKLALPPNRGTDGTVQQLRADQTKNLIDSIRLRINQMEQQEQELLKQETAAAKAIARHTLIVLAIAIALLFLILFIVYCLIYREITYRVQAQKSLKKERNFISAILDTAGALVVVMNQQGQIVNFNRACEQTTGYSAKEVQGQYFWDLFLIAEEIESVKAALAKLQAGQFPNQHENYWLTKNRSRRLIAWSNTALLNNEAAVEYIIGTGIDITERKRAERRLVAQHTVTHLLAESATLSEAAPKILQAMCESLGWDIGELWSLEPQTNMLHLVESWYQSGVEVPAFKAKTKDIFFALGVGLPGRVWSSGEPIWIADVFKDNNFLRSAIAAKEGLHAACGFPILSKDEILGVVTFLSREIQPPDQDLLDMMTVIGRQIGQFIKRKANEEALKQSEERWHLALRGNNDGIWDWNLKTNEVFFSTRWKEILGYEEEEIFNHLEEWMNRVHPDDLIWVKKAIENHLTKKSPFCITEHRILCKDGSYQWILARGQAVWDEDGNPLRMVGASTDITDRRRTEEALRLSQERYELAVSSGKVGVWDWNIQTNEIYIDPIIKEALGYTDFDIQNNLDAWYSLVHPEDREKVIAATKKHLEEFTPQYEIEHRRLHKDSSIRWFLSRGTAFHDADGQPYRMTGTDSDITQQKLTELELEVAHRQAELASQTKSSFLANMSHEIRTPMNAILGMTGLLLETTLNSDQQDFLETIRISGNALLSLINEILDLSKLEAGEMELEDLEFDLSTCIDEVLDLLAPQAHCKGLEIAALVYRNVPTQLKGDAGRLRQILMNLTGNALKFTRAGEVVVRAELLSETETTATIRLGVKDSGIGIAPEDKNKLFAPFSQVDASTTRKYGGTGLGLAICKQLVNLMGGEIGVESEPGIGSEFWFTIPFVKQSTRVAVVKNYEVISGRRLLVVDDNATNRKVIYHQATRWGMQVDEADSATAALLALQAACEQNMPYDLVLLDMRMPETDGMSLGEQIKANSAFAEMPLIMLTSTAQRHEAKRALNIGFAAYLVKPVKPSRLLDTIMNVLGIPTETNDSNLSKTENSSNEPDSKVVSSAAKSKLKILLAEDNLVNQKLAVRQLQNLGYEADVVANGEEVLQLLEKIPYDLILMDCQMPIKDGFETTREIRCRQASLGEERRPIVIAMTANAMKEDRQKCLDAGMDDYLSKPVFKEQLAAAIARWSPVTYSPEGESLEVIEVGDTEENSREIDWDHLHKMSDNNTEFELELLQIYLEDSQVHLESIKGAIASNDFNQLQRKCHHLKGSSGNVGAIAMKLAAETLEQMARRQHLEGTEELITELEGALSRIEALLGTTP